jgi:hypothetical protein
VDVIVGKNDQSCIGAHEQKAANSNHIPPNCPIEMDDYFVGLQFEKKYLKNKRKLCLT